MYVDILLMLCHSLNDEETTLTKACIEQINQLFYMEKEFASLETEERKKQPLMQEKPALEAVWLWIEANKEKIAPKAKLRQAINYAENNKKGLEKIMLIYHEFVNLYGSIDVLTWY